MRRAIVSSLRLVRKNRLAFVPIRWYSNESQNFRIALNELLHGDVSATFETTKRALANATQDEHKIYLNAQAAFCSLKLNQLKQVDQYLHQLKSIAENKNDTLLSNIVDSIILIRNRENREALEKILQLLPSIKLQEDDLKILITIFGEFLLKNEEYDDYFEFIDGVLHYIKKEKDLFKEYASNFRNALLLIGQKYEDEMDYQKCAKIYQKVEELTSIIEGTESEEYVHICSRLITALSNINQVNVAYPYAVKATQTLTNLMNEDPNPERAQLLLNLSILQIMHLQDETSFSKALQLCKKSIQTAEEYNFIDIKVQLIHLLVNIYLGTNELENALESLDKAKELIPSIEEERRGPSLFTNCSVRAFVYNRIGEFKEAIKFAEEALAIARKHNLENVEQEIEILKHHITFWSEQGY